MVTLRLASSELATGGSWFFCETLTLLLLGVTLLNLFVFNSCRVLGKSSRKKSFPGLRVLEQAC